MESMPSEETIEVFTEIYKPTLSVDVTAEPPEDTSTGTTPQTSVTPHVSTNIFVAGVPPTWDENNLYQRFKEFGEIVSTKLVRKRHFAFVMFRKPESAHAAINAMHLTHPTPNSPVKLHVSIAMHDEGVDDLPNDRIFIRGLAQWTTKEHLKQSFAPYGTIVEAAVLTNHLGQCKGSGFVQFSSVEEATAAIEAKKNIRIEGLDSELEVKYSETAEVRQLRQERNKNRQKYSPKYRQRLSPFPFFPQVPVGPPMQTFPMIGVPTSVPVFYPPPPTATAVPSPHVIYPTLVTSPPLPMFTTAPTIFEAKTEAFPSSGDVHLSGVSLSEPVLSSLLQRYGDVSAMELLEDGAAAIRMADRNMHTLIVQELNGLVFSNGQLMVARLYA
ncbi:RNA-binding protein, putative [Trypanosoma brucei gambiense DAL972]|uniref:RNA-binding protein, putative n=1 Tax=Trypanosoma brucei gambiense (strain MHOM/CI/86/DAL972) TaxID=679716 RepID=C9ZLN3_TRYB9|nr:RNA-binding protein, putative [Trypanosoma brucei gambiense DAL972]CBH10308.1 RNA-binding protein, putative [Trypanosoma brucei gambiense DAL972]|eukprot:XP_011772598.1 RNA-binding protein, putative [Trypanosoma brucei gambiense DAL972]